MDDPVIVNAEVLKKMDSALVGSLSDDVINQLIASARLMAIGDGFPQFVTSVSGTIPVLDMATQYMALHMASIQGKTGKGIVMEKVGELQRQYANTSNLGWLNSSKWGQLYLWLYRKYGDAGSRSRVTVIEH